MIAEDLPESDRSEPIVDQPELPKGDIETGLRQERHPQLVGFGQMAGPPYGHDELPVGADHPGQLGHRPRRVAGTW